MLYGPQYGTVDLATAAATFVGEVAEDAAGYWVNFAGDVDNDGFDDILIAAHSNDEGGIDAGTAYLYYGPVYGTMSLSTADARFIGEEAEDAVAPVSSAGDVDGDGFDDILVGGYRNDEVGNGAGGAYLIYGPAYGDIDLSMADVKFLGEAAGDEAGWPLSRGGDIDGDGFDDLLIGATQNDGGGTDAGAAYVFFGLGM